MPKLSEIQVFDRLTERLEQLKSGKSFETRTLGKLLTETQLTELEAEIVSGKAVGRSVHASQTAFIEQVVNAMKADLNNIADRMLERVEIDSAKVFMKAFSEAKADNKNAEAEANAALTRRGFRREDGVDHSTKLDERYEQIHAMEQRLRERLEAELSDAEREQLQHDRKVLADLEQKKVKPSK